MRKVFTTELRFLLVPEETRWIENNPWERVPCRVPPNRLSGSLKAFFWIAVSIGTALVLGQLR